MTGVESGQFLDNQNTAHHLIYIINNRIGLVNPNDQYKGSIF
jgi:hypothetical protein